jgi:CO/xanthine dehydrogenase Mo-binding subunit
MTHEGSGDRTPGPVGRDEPRRDARAKVTGTATYAYDVELAGMLHAKVLRSPHAHARIVSVDATRAAAVPGVHAVLTRDEAAGLGTYGSFVKDQHVVAVDTVRYVGDPVAAVAAVDERTALEALDLIDVVYEPLPEVSAVDDAVADGAVELFPEPPLAIVPTYGPGATAAVRTKPNVCFEYRYHTGPDDLWDGCDHVFEDAFRFSRMSHMHLEPHTTVARADAGRIEVWSATQMPFPLRQELARIFGLPESAVRVHVAMLGGGFGAKSAVRGDAIAARLSQLSGRPVRYCMTVEECYLTVSQHEAVIRVRTGVMADGTFVARSSEMLLNAGAYADYSPLVAEKAGYRMPGAYRWRHIDSVCRAVVTNSVPAGAFRGFGGTQATWANERQLDLIAERLGMDPLELRYKNVLALKERSVPGETPIDSDMSVGLSLVADSIGYRDKHGVERITGTGARRGVGVAIAAKDGGGMNKPGQSHLKVDTAGNVYVQSALVEMGQGGQSAMIQIAADTLRTSTAKVRYVDVDTDHSPFDPGTHSSSGIPVMGLAVQRAAESIRDQALDFAARHLGIPREGLELRDWTVLAPDGTAHPLAPLIRKIYGGPGFEFTAHGFHKDEESQESAFEAPCRYWEVGWCGAEVEVDPETGRIALVDLVICGDAGKVINRLGARGQDEGAAVFGVGQALFEELRYEGTSLLNGEALDYRVPMADDLPPSFRSITQEQGHAAGPYGSKGMGEGGMLPVAPAIAAAVADAVGIQLTELPLTPQRVWAALAARGASGAGAGS